MYSRLIIIGAGGHGKVVADIAQRNGYSEIFFVDDCATGMCMGYPVVGRCTEIPLFDNGDTAFVVAIGNNGIRRKIAETYDVPWATLIHPSSEIGIGVKIGEGTVVMANAVINPCAEIGCHCIINTGAVVEHDNVLGDYVHISPKAALGGTVRIGNESHVGIGAVIRNNTFIVSETVIGAGAVVVKNIEESGTYIGLPAKNIG